MKVIVNGVTYYVGWRYFSTKLQQLLDEAGIKEEEARKMKKSDILETLGIKTFPSPDITHCLIKKDGGEKKEEKEVLIDMPVRKYHKDKYNVEKARKYSLLKALKGVFAPDDKETRKLFWDAYLNRFPKKDEKQEKPAYAGPFLVH